MYSTCVSFSKHGRGVSFHKREGVYRFTKEKVCVVFRKKKVFRPPPSPKKGCFCFQKGEKGHGVYVAKWTFFLFFCASRITSFVVHDFLPHSMVGSSGACSNLDPLRLFQAEFSSLGASEETCPPN